ncbi:MAG: hypothetical protein V1913_16590 [Fibrobacterota bacterium]
MESAALLGGENPFTYQLSVSVRQFCRITQPFAEVGKPFSVTIAKWRGLGDREKGTTTE